MKAPGHAARTSATDGIKRAAAGGRPAGGGMRMRRYFVGRGAAAVVATVTILAAGGMAFAAGPATVSQNPSPYAAAGCTALDAGQSPSKNYLNSEVEPMVAIDPTDSTHLVGAWQQDRWSDGGAHGLEAGSSTDRGSSWTVSPQPFSVCYHDSGFSGNYLNYQRASDPWVSIGPGKPGSPGSGSTVYAISISFDQTAYPGDPNATHNAVGAAASYDRGATQSPVQSIIADPCVSGTPTGTGAQAN